MAFRAWARRRFQLLPDDLALSFIAGAALAELAKFRHVVFQARETLVHGVKALVHVLVLGVETLVDVLVLRIEALAHVGLEVVETLALSVETLVLGVEALVYRIEAMVDGVEALVNGTERVFVNYPAPILMGLRRLSIKCVMAM